MEDITGKRFNRYTAIRFDHKNKNCQQMWLFQCDCGVEKVVRAKRVVYGEIKSCGCLAPQLLAASANPKHGYRGSPTYNTWRGMKERCAYRDKYPHYAGKGIAVCKKWETFLGFLEDMGERPDGKTLDRLDGTKPYEKSNCRWATLSEQAQNRKASAKSGFKGVIRSGMRWRSIICFNNKQIHLGNFDTAKEAAQAYNEAAKKYYGDDACINSIA